MIKVHFTLRIIAHLICIQMNLWLLLHLYKRVILVLIIYQTQLNSLDNNCSLYTWHVDTLQVTWLNDECKLIWWLHNSTAFYKTHFVSDPIDPPQNKTSVNMSHVKKFRWIFQTITSPRLVNVLCHNNHKASWSDHLKNLPTLFITIDMFVDVLFCGGSTG